MEIPENHYRLSVAILALVCGFLHRDHVSVIFENDRHFSHLSEVEREMSFRTEMGMYYYYFKIITEAPTFFEGLKLLWNDSYSQYPREINAQKVYNLFPEILGGFLYHKAKQFNLFNNPQCWQVERGDGLSTVKSCQGLAVPSYFYTEFVWYFAGMTGALIFLYATYLSDSIFGGLVAFLSFLFNHTECTRVQWTPPLRESFAYPILLWQMYTISVVIDKYRYINLDKKFNWRYIFKDFPFLNIFIPTTLSLACWQFSQFVLMTQVIALLILHWLKILPKILILQLTSVHLLSIGLSGFFGNLNSFSLYAALVVGIMYSNDLLIRLENVLSANTLIILDIVATFGFTYLQKFILTMAFEDYSHIFDILKAKLTDYKDFHTLLYTCSPEFDFLPYAAYETIVRTYLLPTAILAGVLAVYFWYRNYKITGWPDCIEASVAYNALQTGAFIVMASMIMRLKLFMNPHLCLIAGLVVSKRYLEKLGLKHETYRQAFILVVVAVLCYQGIDRIENEGKAYGEFSDIEQEELFTWIKNNTPEDAVFAGKMSLMANLLLTTRRPIVNNPFYESKVMRDRTLKVYEIYGRKDAAAVYETLRKMQVDYLVIDEGLCYGLGNPKPGCKLIDLWDVMDNGRAKSLGKRPLCPILSEGNSHPFKRVFANDQYVVLRLDYSTYVEFKPNSPMVLQSA
ncbi:C-mannosyltransferase dpy-19 [Microplitis mediator]|uniref:C-mannosyltransferase dpy-19 n=1 Tax=Microplitis mediator TaxID=375433 RepID=UPI0025530F6C|nr:C-mannosyltransferase dpy-19 [Microplitis mediator]